MMAHQKKQITKFTGKKMENKLAFSVSAACNILSASGYSYNEIELELIKLKEAGKIKDGYVLSCDLPKIKSIN